jgi:ABC-2 type transport system permease protein
MAMAMLFCLAVALTFVAAAVTVSPLELTLLQLLAFVSVCLAGALPFCAIGMFVGTCVSGRAAPGVVNLIYLPAVYLSNMLIPLPPSIGFISILSPAFHLNQLVLGSIGRPPVLPVAIHVGVLIAVTVTFGALASRRLARM